MHADANHPYPNPTLSRPEARGARPAGMEAGEGEQQQAGLPAPTADRRLALPPGVPAAAALPQYFCVAVSLPRRPARLRTAQGADRFGHQMRACFLCSS